MIKLLIRKVFTCLMVTMLCISFSIPIAAGDRVSISSIYSYPTNSNEQWRFITVVQDPKWTALKTLEGQPTRGTYLKKGDSLYFGETGGKSVGISFGVSLGPPYANASASVNFDIPLGKTYSSYFGKSLRASSSGYYLIKAKKYIKPTIVFIQYRHKQNGYLQNGKWGKWEKPKVYTPKNKYEVVQSYSTLVKQ